MQWLIDHQGVNWPGSAHRIASWAPGCDPISYAVSERGFIHIQLTTDAMIVRFNPSRVRPYTTIGAFYLMADTQPRRVVILYGYEDRNIEIVGSVAQAIQRIQEVVGSQISCGTAAMSAQRRSLNRPIDTFEQSIAVLLRAWAEAGGRWSAEREANFRAANMLENAAVVRKPRASNRLVIDYWYEGDGRDVFGRRWSQIARGKDLEDQPFPDVGARTAFRLRAMLAGDRKPHLHRVNLLVPAAGGNMLRHQYERLVLPWTGFGGEDYLVSWMFFKNNFDISHSTILSLV
jgi:hypothetical protein